ncbi:MAG: copper ion binding protein [Nitrososphaerota archaeon]|nr:copper ion binding protein [Nitrososphaerota archaeon]
MEKLLLKVNGIFCEHCVKAITESVSTLSGIFNVKVDLQTKTVTVEYNSALITAKAIEDKIEEQGYDICTC